MSSPFYKEVRQFAFDMIAAAKENNVEAFDSLYDDLKKICADNKEGKNNHPVQWETLADFTEDPIAAIDLYKQALTIAEGIKAHEYMASINYAIADRYQELGDDKTALSFVKQAKEHAEKLDDTELKGEINDLLAMLEEE